MLTVFAQRLLAEVVALHRGKHRFRGRFACGYGEIHTADGKAEVHTHSGSITGNQHTFTHQFRLHIHTGLRYDVRGIFHQLATSDQWSNRRMLFEIFQHLWDRFFSIFQMMKTADQPQRKGRFISIEEAPAHQPIGWRTGKQAGCAFVPL